MPTVVKFNHRSSAKQASGRGARRGKGSGNRFEQPFQKIAVVALSLVILCTLVSLGSQLFGAGRYDGDVRVASEKWRNYQPGAAGGLRPSYRGLR